MEDAPVSTSRGNGFFHTRDGKKVAFGSKILHERAEWKRRIQHLRIRRGRGGGGGGSRVCDGISGERMNEDYSVFV